MTSEQHEEQMAEVRSDVLGALSGEWKSNYVVAAATGLRPSRALMILGNLRAEGLVEAQRRRLSDMEYEWRLLPEQ